jgi:hypothetical protein
LLEVADNVLLAGVKILKLDKLSREVQVNVASLNLTESFSALTLKAKTF